MSFSKLLDLPHLAVQKILNCMDIIDLLDFSLISKKAFHIARLHQNKATHCNLTIRRTFDRKVCVEIVFSDCLKLSWFFSDRPKLLLPGETISIRTIGGFTFAQSGKNHVTNSMFVFNANPTEQAFRAVAEHLIRLFPCTMDHIEVDPATFFPPQSFADWRVVQKCRSLTMRGVTTSKENLETVINAVQVRDRVEIIGYEGEEVKCPRLADLKELTLHVKNISEDTLHTIKAERIEIGENSFPGRVLGKFLGQWMNGEKEHVKTLKVSVEHHYFSDRQFSAIFRSVRGNGLKRVDQGATLHPKYYQYDKTTLYDTDRGHTFRNCNGKLATVLVSDYCFVFLVWNESSPRITAPRGMYFTVGKKAILIAKHDTPRVYRDDVEATEIDAEKRVSI